MCVQVLEREATPLLDPEELAVTDPWCVCHHEPCPSCDLAEAGPCPACNGRGWLELDDPEC